MDVQRVLAAIAEPTRFRIVQLLTERPRTVGEVAIALGALQPQTTKHLQALEQAGVVVVHPLGRRRVAAIRRETFRELGDLFQSLGIDHPSENVLERYADDIAVEESLPRSESRQIVLRRRIAASAATVWAAFTQPDLLRQWWAPEHFELVEQDFVPVPGRPIEIVLGEGDGARYRAAGTMHEVEDEHLLAFDLSPIGPDGLPLFAAHFRVALAVAGPAATDLTLEIGASEQRPGAAPAVAGLEPGWSQQLDRLEQLVGGP